jgi:ribose/xylose/arabinose/galactoside ABC-type transport system permease subunit
MRALIWNNKSERYNQGANTSVKDCANRRWQLENNLIPKERPMKFRQRFFWFLAFVALMWIVYGLTVTGQAVDEVGATAVSSAEQAGVAVGAGLAMTTFMCTGLPFFFLFALLAWRNGVGLRTEKRHQEMLEATRGAAKA